MHSEKISDEQWVAILQNDKRFDTLFFYAVKSTGIFCRPSCKSRPPKKEHVQIYLEANDAIRAGYRPCKRCKPTGTKLPYEEWVQQIKVYMDKHLNEPLTLNHLAHICHGSPYHLQRTFKKVLEISPVEYLQQIRIEKAKELLIKTDKSLEEIGSAIGMHNIPYFITLFKKKTGHTPSKYRKKEDNTNE
ncbi:bifunctional transcriptional activator/DNA repair enzyme AdaA [Bacillus sp. FJAT-22090]|uniref:bifunctional transcriptional activator/DNA repair enzyme AdaA n=1 Tax=Bacillus sp. FJAT-22090 TaxID=1581038 RepID=UPI0011A94518|nr:bifunctional transcriptional activator/DNA repair enzyme AdaA [Bacillus sp. FJAT-22090]